MTYDNLAEASGVSRRTIISVENGTSPGSMETWARLAMALNVGFDELFTAATGLESSVAPDPKNPHPVMKMKAGNPLAIADLPRSA